MLRLRRVSILAILSLALGCGKEPSGEKTTAFPVEPTAFRIPDGQIPTKKNNPAPPRSDSSGKAKTPIPPDMLPVPGGEFTMGLDDRGIPDERPAHRVTVKPFLLDKTEVTHRDYARCVDAGVCRPPAFLTTEESGFEPLDVFRSPDRPVVGVSHSDAETYCRFADKRLPREAEWERAARGSDARLFPWGDTLPTPEQAVFRAKVTGEVGSRPKGAGPYGHLDLAGNVWEWVADRYDPYAYTRDTAHLGIPGDCNQILLALRELKRTGKQGFTGTNPIPDVCENVLRGGAFNYFPWGLRSSNRVHHPGRFRIAMAGFRCAKDHPQP